MVVVAAAPVSNSLGVVAAVAVAPVAGGVGNIILTSPLCWTSGIISGRAEIERNEVK